MDLKDIWDIIHVILKKESRGNVIKPADFTPLLQKAHLEYYNQQYEKWAGSQTVFDSLRPFVVLDETLTVSVSGTAISGLVNSYKHIIGARTATGNYNIDIVTPNQYNAWMGDAVMQGTSTHPVMTIDSTKFYLSPTEPAGIDAKISYLVECDEDTALTGTDTATDFYLPFFDYYLDANYTVQYLSNGTAHALTAGEVYRDGTSTGNVTGKSHELKWADYDKVNIVSFILRELGVGLQSADISQYAMALEQKQNVM